MDAEKLKKRIMKRFMKSPKGKVRLNLKNGTKLAIEYTYGGKYNLLKKHGDRALLMALAVSPDKLVDLILAEKDKQITKTKKRTSEQIDMYSILKYTSKMKKASK